MSALSGAVIAPVTTATYNMGLSLSLEGFVAWVLGGLVSPIGVVLAGVGLGVSQGMLDGYLPTSVLPYAGAFPYLILVLVLVARPHGLVQALPSRRV